MLKLALSLSFDGRKMSYLEKQIQDRDRSLFLFFGAQ